MKRYGRTLTWAGLAVILLALVAAWAPSAPAHAAARQRSATSDTLTLSMANGTTFTYGGTPAPTFTAVLVLAQPFATNRFWTVVAQLDGSGQKFANVDPPSESSDKLIYTFTIPTSGTLIAPGNHSATATFDNYDTSAITTSNTVNFTMAKAAMSLSCGMSGGANLLWKPGQSEQVTLTAQNTASGTSVDWTQGTANVWFVGPTTVTDSSLHPDSSGNVTVTTPSQIGSYALDCSFTGTTYYAASQMTTTNKDVLISEMQQLGGIQLYTNPTTLVVNRATQMYIVFKAGPGLPTPTGEFNINIGVSPNFYYTQALKIGANGTAFVTVGAIPNLYGATNITVYYEGDPYYKAQSVNFPMTNPAIPSGGSAPTGGGATGKATTTPSATTTATSSGIADGIGGGTSSEAPSASSPSVLSSFGLFSGGGLIALLIVLGLLVVAGGVGGYVYLSRRASQSAMSMRQAPEPPEPPLPYRYGDYGDDTAPRRRFDR